MVEQPGRGPLPFAESDYSDVTAGDRYDLQVLIGEQPGVEFNACLLLQKDGREYAKDTTGNAILPIFKIARSENNATGGPQTAADTPWSARRAEKP